MSEQNSNKNKLYRSFLTGEPLTLREAGIATVGAGDIVARPRFRGTVDQANPENPDDNKAVEAINLFYWDALDQDVFGRRYMIFECDNYIARPLPDEQDSTNPDCHGVAGHVCLNVEEEGFLHIVVFSVWPQWHGRGVGRKLVDKAIDVAGESGLSSVKLGTTNDNLPALYFYQRLGFKIEKVLPGIVEQEHGGEQVGFAGIPVRDEIRLRLDV